MSETPVGVTVSQFQLALDESSGLPAAFVQILHFGPALWWVWIGDSQAQAGDLAVAFPGVHTAAARTSVLGSLNDSVSEELCAKLSQRLRNPIYLSYNYLTTARAMAELEKALLVALKDRQLV
ncbi:hypothetical protein TCAL_04619 [Tigriopus californicus]|uniref:Proteasome assembly chaperone 4 n=1 Tax=Tigriopus californicus TaxID=6832 RepID=A0A553NBB3_TIGCA|nr:hypothetical protein TCAL_04619 [Tigriopus californicus]